MLLTSAGVEPATSCLQSDCASNWATQAGPAFVNSVETNWSGAALFVIKYVNLHQHPR